MAESILLRMIAEQNLGDHYVVESAGTGSWHVGEMPNPRTIKIAEQYGCTEFSPARQVADADFDRFDLILAADRGHLLELKRWTNYKPEPVRLMMSFAPELGIEEVPDPYYGELDGFERVYTMLEAACKNLLQQTAPPAP